MHTNINVKLITEVISHTDMATCIGVCTISEQVSHTIHSSTPIFLRANNITFGEYRRTAFLSQQRPWKVLVSTKETPLKLSYNKHGIGGALPGHKAELAFFNGNGLSDKAVHYSLEYLSSIFNTCSVSFRPR